MGELSELIRDLKAFRDARDWEQFHTTRNLAVSLSIEAAELLEILQWVEADAAEQRATDERERLEEELADIAIYLLLLLDRQGLDLATIVRKKLHKNGLKYPVEKSRGTAAKYNEL